MGKSFFNVFCVGGILCTTCACLNVEARNISNRDTVPPTITGFSLPSSTTRLTVSGIVLTATDKKGVTGYLIKESATAPVFNSAGWTSTAPSSFTFPSAGTRTLYAWAKDAAGNISAARSASVVITLSTPTPTPTPTLTPTPTPTATPAPTVTPTPPSSTAKAILYSPHNQITVNGTVQLTTATDLDIAGTGAAIDHVDYFVDGAIYKTYRYATDPARIRVTETGVADGFTYSASTSPKNPNPFAVIWDTTSFANGTHSVHAVVYPASGGAPITTPANVVTVSNATYPNTIPATPVTIAARAKTSATIRIAGGHFTSPYTLGTAGREYILDSDVHADGTAFLIQASSIVLNLNGHSVFYNEISPGDGVATAGWNYQDIAITNGAIIQGPAMSEGDVYGRYNNPVRMSPYTARNVQIANVYARYGGRDVGGFYLRGCTNVIVEGNTLEDLFLYGTVKDRHQGVDAISGIINAPNTIRNNTIINARHRGIQIGTGGLVYGNKIGIRSVCTNSYGVFNWSSHNTKIYNNTISGTGEMVIGIGVHGDLPGPPVNNEVYGNSVSVQVTRLGLEYASAFVPGTSTGVWVSDNAAGFRSSTGADQLFVHDNVFQVYSDAAYAGTHSASGAPVTLATSARGIWAALDAPGHVAVFRNNTVIATDRDGTGMAEGIACAGAHAGGVDSSMGLSFIGNTVTSNILNVALSDDYAQCPSHPLFLQNTFIRSGSSPKYHTIGVGGTGGGSTGFFAGTGTFISNTYQGASESNLNMHFEYPSKNKSVIFGRAMNALVSDAQSVPLPGKSLQTVSSSGTAQTATSTDATGQAKFLLYDFELNNANGATRSTTPLRAAFAPHSLRVIDPLSNVKLFSVSSDGSPEAWDSTAGSGNYLLDSGTGTIAITW